MFLKCFRNAFAHCRHPHHARPASGAHPARQRLIKVVRARRATIVYRAPIEPLVQLANIARLERHRQRRPYHALLENIVPLDRPRSIKADFVLLAFSVRRAPISRTAPPVGTAHRARSHRVAAAHARRDITALPGRSAWRVSARIAPPARRRRIAYRASRAINAPEAVWYKNSALRARMPT